MNEKTAVDRLKEELFYKTKHISKVQTPEELASAGSYCEGYKAFLSAAKTEREAVREAVKMAKERGFAPYRAGQPLKEGDRVYLNNRGKALILAVIGSETPDRGLSIAAAHVDSPRIDLKPNPLYEAGELCYFDTHYYGGIKKYQWTAVPLALYGVVVRKDGASVRVAVGDDPGDPVFCVTDLLPHLSSEQMNKKGTELIKGEAMDILIGSRPFRSDEGSELCKLNIMNILHEKYGITEADFQSAELEAVPAGPCRDVGWDRSMLGGYGHDDRVCAYPALTALFELEKPRYTALVVLADKEETGSEGVSGMQSDFLPHFIEELADAAGVKSRYVYERALCLSADVNAAFDPLYPEVVESRNCPELNHGVVLTKYTGSRGKSGTSDASAETMGKFRALMDGNSVLWQVGELGRVDAGGGGTVAKYLANMNIETVDLGVPVLSMHSPFEVVAKADVHMAHRAFSALLSRGS